MKLDKLISIVALGATIAIALPSIANAGLLPNSKASELILNFDMSAEMVGPSYQNLGLTAFFSHSISNGSLGYDLFGNLNGQDLVSGATSSFFQPLAVFSFASSTDSRILDGVFSVGLYDLSGSIDVDYVVAQGYKNNFTVASGLVRGAAPAISNDVPEPATIAIVGVGLAALVLQRRRNIVSK